MLALLVVLVVLMSACSQKPAENTETQAQQSASGTPPVPPTVSEPEGVYRIILVSYPVQVDIGQKFNITWKIESNKKNDIQGTRVYYGSAKVANPSATTDYKFSSKALSGSIPSVFSSEFAFETYGTLYFRTHAVIDRKEYWGEEKAIVVNPPKPQEKTAQVKQFMIGADDAAFYPGDPIKVNKGEKVYIEFDVHNDNVYYGGLQVKSPYFDTGKINKGEKATVDFTATDSFTITSYWPATGVKKADLKVVVS